MPNRRTVQETRQSEWPKRHRRGGPLVLVLWSWALIVLGASTGAALGSASAADPAKPFADIHQGSSPVNISMQPTPIQLPVTRRSWKPPIGWACPPRRSNPVGETSAFGLSVVAMWALSRRRAMGGEVRSA